MSTRYGRRLPSGFGGKGPRIPTVAWALPLGAFLLFTALTGRVDLINAFSGDATSIERILAERAALGAAVRAQETPTAATLLVETATPTASPQFTACEPSGDPRFCLYTVQEGDSLASIATRFDLDGGDLPGWELLFASNQPDLISLDEFLQPGLVLRVPHSIGVLHLVLPGDSVSRLAEDYGVTTEEIATANALADSDSVQIGDILLISEPTSRPQPELPAEPDPEGAEEPDEASGEESPDEASAGEDAEPPDEEGVPLGEGEASDEQTNDGDGAGEESDEQTDDAESGSDDSDEQAEEADTDGRDPNEPEEGADGDEEDAAGDDDEEESAEPEQTEEPAESEPEEDDPTRMSWPVVHVKITNYMTARHPLGMDFGLGAHQGSPIMAAAGGTVSFAGGNACCSYGYYVIVDHGGGLQTLYAHFSSISVRKGDVVDRGQTLGIAGATGNSRGVHLHFEVYKDGKRVDPMNYLPRD